MPKFTLTAKERFMIRTRMLSLPCGTVDEQVRYDKLWDTTDIGAIDDQLHAQPNRTWNENDFDEEPKTYELTFSLLRTIKDLFTPSPNRPLNYAMARYVRTLLEKVENAPSLNATEPAPATAPSTAASTDQLTKLVQD